VANGEIAADGDGTPRDLVAISQRNGAYVSEGFRVENDQLAGAELTQHRRATHNDHEVCFLADRHAKRLDVKIALFVLSHNIT